MLAHVNHLLVRRLVKLYDPWTAIGLAPDFTWLKSATPVSVFKPELVMDEERDMEYHKGRVKFFVDQLQKGLELEPIEVDNACEGCHIYPYPVVPDGNHRLLAYWAAKRKTIPATYGGRIDLLKYLEGKSRKKPEE